jgi:hypothetical protein
MSNRLITALIGAVFFIATLICVGLLKIAGRRTLMLYCHAFMTVDLLVLGALYIELNNSLMILTVLAHIVLFSFSSGPIVWLYMSEIMCDKALSIATMINWLFTLIISLTTLPLY